MYLHQGIQNYWDKAFAGAWLGLLVLLALSWSAAAIAQPTITITSADTTLDEAGALTATPDIGTFTITRSDISGDALVVNIAITGSATNDSDFITDGVFGLSQKAVTIPAGAMQSVVTLTPQVDNRVEGTEDIIVQLQPQASLYTIGSSNEVNFSIIDDAVEINLVPMDGSMAELNLDTGSFVLTRSDNGKVSESINVNIGVTGSANNSDFTITPAFGLSQLAVTIAGGSFEQVVTLTPRPDNVVEGTEDITVTLQPRASVYTIGSSDEAIFSLSDDVAEVNLSLLDGSMSELGLDPGSILLSRSNGGKVSNSINVNIAITGTAINGSDFTISPVFGASPIRAAIPANALEQIITLTPRADMPDNEPEETIVVTLQPGSSYALGSATSVTLALEDFMSEVLSDGFESSQVLQSKMTDTD